MKMFINRLEDVNLGLVGTISRTDNLLIDPVFFKDGTKAVTVGRAVKLNAKGKAEYLTTADDVTNGLFYGVLSRAYPTNTIDDPSLGEDLRPTNEPLDCVRKGFLLVKCVKGTPVKGGKVYIYTTANGGNKVGDFSAEADSTNTTELKGVTFASNLIDTNKVTEIVIL